MTAWKANEHIDFDFFDAHDINTALDTSQPDTIRRRLRERLANTKQAIVLLSQAAKNKSSRSNSFFYYELEVIKSLELPVVFSNLNGSRNVQNSLIPAGLASPYYTVSVSFQPKIIRYALDGYVQEFEQNLKSGKRRTGPHYYEDSHYQKLGL